MFSLSSNNMIIFQWPGIYIRPDDTSIPKEFRGIGIRIEDDVLITDGDPVILTDSCVKEVADIEALVGTQSLWTTKQAKFPYNT